MDAELWYLTEKPELYARTAAWVDIALRHSAKPCIGGCDLDATCKRHARTTAIVWRYSRRHG